MAQKIGFTINGSEQVSNDSIGPSIYCYLQYTIICNGGKVNSTPYFVAQVTDANGINAAGNGVGHDMQLIIDGDMMRTYTLTTTSASTLVAIQKELLSSVFLTI